MTERVFLVNEASISQLEFEQAGDTFINAAQDAFYSDVWDYEIQNRQSNQETIPNYPESYYKEQFDYTFSPFPQEEVPSAQALIELRAYDYIHLYYDYIQDSSLRYSRKLSNARYDLRILSCLLDRTVLFGFPIIKKHIDNFYWRNSLVNSQEVF